MLLSQVRADLQEGWIWCRNEPVFINIIRDINGWIWCLLVLILNLAFLLIIQLLMHFSPSSSSPSPSPSWYDPAMRSSAALIQVELWLGEYHDSLCSNQADGILFDHSWSALGAMMPFWWHWKMGQEWSSIDPLLPTPRVISSKPTWHFLPALPLDMLLWYLLHSSNSFQNLVLNDLASQYQWPGCAELTQDFCWYLIELHWSHFNCKWCAETGSGEQGWRPSVGLLLDYPW